MNIKSKLYYLLREYVAGNYETETFCVAMCDLFYPDTPKGELSNTEYNEFEKLAYISARFSPYENDHIICSNAFATEQEVHGIALEVYQKLVGRG